MIIPHRELSVEALQGLIEEFVTRDGTDYGVSETPRDVKVDQVRRCLESGDAMIVFDDQTGSCTVMLAEQISKDMREGAKPETDRD